MGLTLEDVSPGYAPHDVHITFDNRYGVCRDKAALLVAMLRIAGFEAYPVLIHVGPKKDEDVPLPYFNHAIAAVAQPSTLNPQPSTLNSQPSTLNSQLKNDSLRPGREGEERAARGDAGRGQASGVCARAHRRDDVPDRGGP